MIVITSPSVCLAVFLSVSPSYPDYHFGCQLICLSFCMSVCLSVSPSVCLSVCLTPSFTDEQLMSVSLSPNLFF